MTAAGPGERPERTRLRSGLRSILRGDSTLAQILRFLSTSGISASITMGLPILLHELFGVAPELAVALAFVCAFCVNFITARKFVFKSSGGITRDFMAFAGSSLAFRLAEYLLFLLFHSVLDLPYVAALLLILTSATVAKFFWYRRILAGARS